MKKALLLIDRGSREQDVQDELQNICTLTKTRGGYYYSDFAFLEVIPPYIEEGINRCIENGAEFLTVMPYFLYPGMKLKEAVKQSERLATASGLRFAITECLNYHIAFVEIVKDRISQVKKNERIDLSDKQVDILLIGHGSSDTDARNAFVFMADSLKNIYRNVGFCFLELDTPDIEDGIRLAVDKQPRVLILMPYFLHRGVHIKRDVKEEVKKALQHYNSTKVCMAEHLGVDDKIIDVILERAREAEQKLGI